MNNYITPNWPAPKKVKAFTTKRTGGFSKSPYDSFNFSLRTGDNPDDVLANHKKLYQELNLPTKPFWLKQDHTNIAIHLKQSTTLTEPLADAAFSTPSNPVCAAITTDRAPILVCDYTGIADASFATTPNLVCAVMTADCVPILVCDRTGTIVAAIHAGWKGIAAGIIEATIKAMNINPAKLLAWLGPAIGVDSFETGEDVRKIFVENNPETRHAFTAHRDYFLTNIYLLASQRLNDAGITAIYGGEYCTFTQKDLFFSFRRDGTNSGRMASLIWLTA